MFDVAMEFLQLLLMLLLTAQIAGSSCTTDHIASLHLRGRHRSLSSAAAVEFAHEFNQEFAR